MATDIISQGRSFDFLIVGAGMAGASAAYFLSTEGSVLMLEMESQPGYHTTGRSAALFSEAYGNAPIRALTSSGRAFLIDPPDGFANTAILTPRGALFVGREDQMASLDAAYEAGAEHLDSVQRLTARDVRELVPVLREGYAAAGVLEADAMDMDVNALHQGFLRGARGRGAQLRQDARVAGLKRENGAWRVRAGGENFFAKVVINAAGAWCDEVATLAGARPVGLVPKRRTAILFDGPSEMPFAAWPAFIDADEEFYARPESGALMGSPADETPMAPCDVQAEELDIAIAVDRLQTATTLEIRRIIRSWAGLRSFVADKTPVVGFDPEVDGFFWLAGQGGYGIQTSPSMGRVAAALARGDDVPADLQQFGVVAAELSPGRFGPGPMD
ncbi:MAG: FAD-dependent oxidoreductase [Proteobacteria bacterium]|nr:FAD-dependent oxidoreductase [Pseudomonadota bacterium]